MFVHILLAVGILLCIFASRLVRLFHYVVNLRRMILMTNDIPSLERHWFYGSLKEFEDMSQLIPFAHSARKKYGDIIRAWCGPFIPTIVLFHPDLAKEVLRTSEPKSESMSNYGALKAFIGSGLAISGGAKWHRNRRLLEPAFHSGMMWKYFGMIDKSSDTFLDILDAYCATGKSFDIFEPASMFTLESMLRCIFSFQSDVQHDRHQVPLVRIASRAMQLIWKRARTPYMWLDWVFYLTSTGREFKKVCEGFSSLAKSFIQARRDSLRSGKSGEECNDFLDILLRARDEDGVGLSREEIEDECKSVMIAGHDTSSAAISWTLYELARHPMSLAKCRKEVSSVCGDGNGTKIAYEDLGKLTYLSMVIKESLRLYDPLPLISRTLTRDLKVGGHVLPTGCDVIIALELIHRNPDVWPEPDKFRPERFDPESSEAKARSSFAHVPFSAGPRSCIGRHFATAVLKLALSKIISRFDIIHDPKYPVVKMPEVTLKSKHGLWVKLNRR